MLHEMQHGWLAFFVGNISIFNEIVESDNGDAVTFSWLVVPVVLSHFTIRAVLRGPRDCKSVNLSVGIRGIRLL